MPTDEIKTSVLMTDDDWQRYRDNNTREKALLYYIVEAFHAMDDDEFLEKIADARQATLAKDCRDGKILVLEEDATSLKALVAESRTTSVPVMHAGLDAVL